MIPQPVVARRSRIKRRDVVAAMTAASLFLLAVLAVFAVELSDNQAKSKSDIEARLHERSVLASALLDSLFQTSSQPTAQDARNYGTATVSNAVMERNRAQNTYALLLNSTGGVLAHSRGFTPQARADLASSATLKLLRAGAPWAVGNVLPYGTRGVIDFGREVPTAFGQRFLLTGFTPTELEVFLQGELKQIPGVKGAYDYLLDGNQKVLASTNPSHPAGSVFLTPTHPAAHRQNSGDVGSVYFDQAQLGGTTWRILLTAPDGALFATVSGWRRWVPWLILIAFALVGIAALALARRGLRSGEQVRDANARLADANEQLAQANLRLEQMNGELADSNGALADSNDALERRATELTRSNSELDQFASIASHDLQEPLRKIRTFTQRVWETESASLSERARDDLERANASAERMQRLIEDLLRFSRVSTQGRPFHPVDRGRLAGDVLDDLDESVRSSGAIVRVGALPTISADEPQMRQLMQNLLSNAIKFRRQADSCSRILRAAVQALEHAEDPPAVLRFEADPVVAYHERQPIRLQAGGDLDLGRDALANEMKFAVDGQDLLDYLRREGRWADPSVDAPRPGIILLDLNMPKKDGREALAEIKADTSLRRIPVVVLTTSNDEADVLGTYDLGSSLASLRPARQTSPVL